MEEQVDVCVIGGGVSGLSTAFFLKNKVSFKLLEANAACGGVMRTRQEGNFTLDIGPNSCVMNDALQEVVDNAGLQNELETATRAAANRYLLRDDKLHKISPDPKAILSSGYISIGAKWRLFTEWMRKTEAANGETVAQFVERRFGTELLDYVFEPVLAGIYAGDETKMGLQAVLPVLKEWEKEYGSVTKGLFANTAGMKPRSIIHFKGGMQRLCAAMAETIGEEIICNAGVTEVHKVEGGYKVSYTDRHKAIQTILAKRVVFSTPFGTTVKLLGRLDARVKELPPVEYAPVGVLHLAFNKEDLKAVPEAFGFLVPAMERKPFLGCIFSSQIFPSVAPEDHVLFTLFAGGSKKGPSLFYNTDALLDHCANELKTILHIAGAPVLKEIQIWPQGIPQYNLNTQITRNYFLDKAKHPEGIYFASNYFKKVGIADLVAQGKETAAAIVSL
jgi:oxygen-dependent protoporphyrinogen oxidase